MKNMDGSDADKQVFADTWRSGQAMFRDFMGGEKQRSCGKVGKVGEVPSKEEFCFYVRAHKWARKIACSAKVEAEEILENGSAIQDHDIMMKVVKGWVDKGGNAKLPYKKAGKGGKVGMCSAGMKKSGGGMKDVPTIYKEINGKVFKGSFCPPKGEWYWSVIATCGLSGWANKFGSEEQRKLYVVEEVKKRLGLKIDSKRFAQVVDESIKTAEKTESDDDKQMEKTLDIIAKNSEVGIKDVDKFKSTVKAIIADMEQSQPPQMMSQQYSTGKPGGKMNYGGKSGYGNQVYGKAGHRNRGQGSSGRGDPTKAFVIKGVWEKLDLEDKGVSLHDMFRIVKYAESQHGEGFSDEVLGEVAKKLQSKDSSIDVETLRTTGEDVMDDLPAGRPMQGMNNSFF